MTIAACYVSPEGVVLGADSTSTFGQPGSRHYYNHAQKLFEIGSNSTLGIVAWGLGGLSLISYRLMIANLDDDLAANPAASLDEVADRWATSIWGAYCASPIWPSVQECRRLGAMLPFDSAANPAPAGARTEEEEKQFNTLRMGLVAGFCIGGYVMPSREPSACEVLLDPLGTNPTITRITNGYRFWVRRT